MPCMLLINLWRFNSIPAGDYSSCTAGRQVIGTLYILVIKVSYATYDNKIDMKGICVILSRPFKCCDNTAQVRPRPHPFKNSLIIHRPENSCYLYTAFGSRCALRLLYVHLGISIDARGHHFQHHL
jgi:hypothetical protein